MSLYHDSGVPVKLYVREEGSSVCAEAERLSATMTVDVGVRTIDLLHVATALDQTASGFRLGGRREAHACAMRVPMLIDTDVLIWFFRQYRQTGTCGDGT